MGGKESSVIHGGIVFENGHRLICYKCICFTLFSSTQFYTLASGGMEEEEEEGGDAKVTLTPTDTTGRRPSLRLNITGGGRSTGKRIVTVPLILNTSSTVDD